MLISTKNVFIQISRKQMREANKENRRQGQILSMQHQILTILIKRNVRKSVMRIDLNRGSLNVLFIFSGRKTSFVFSATLV